MSHTYGNAGPVAGKPPVAGWDVAVSICLLVCSLLGCVAVAVAGFFVLAFADYCPPESCHPDRAVSWLGVGVAVSALTVVGGVVGVTVSVIRRKRAWPVAVVVAVVCVIGCGGGIVSEFASLW
ncbi:hypothetical protein ACIRRA_38500 [Nocardia sp. NPDC101769]|uniref:hypothetical protein n=1 Tax=Nocardia sp. NPDC101769 TaxID=3364333 RepID=UPI00381F9A26